MPITYPVRYMPPMVTSGAMSPDGAGSNPAGGTTDASPYFILFSYNGGPERREVLGGVVNRPVRYLLV